MKLWPFHHHRFVEVSREFLARSNDRPLMGIVGTRSSPVTVITERCVDNRCRKWKQVTLKGHVPGTQSDKEEPARHA